MNRVILHFFWDLILILVNFSCLYMRIHIKYCKRHGQDTRPFVTYGPRLNFMFKSKQNDELKMNFRKNRIKL